MLHQFSSLFTKRLTVVACLLFLAGCSDLARKQNEPSIPPLDQASMTNAVKTLGDAHLQNTDAISSIETSFEDVFINRATRKSDPFPYKKISGLSFNDATVVDALRLVLAGTNISLTMNNSASRNQAVYGSVATFSLSGTLEEVIETISKSAGFYYTYKDGNLIVHPDEQFIVNLPPVIADDVFAGMANMVTKLGGFDVYLDRQGRSMVFRANRASADSINSYLENVRTNRHMIVYDTYIYQVELSDSRQIGIDWSKLALSGALDGNPLSITAAKVAGGAALTSGQGMGFNAVYDSKDLSIAALFTFLQTQGNVKTVAQPKIAILSGAKGTFRVGSETNYVSKVGTNSGSTLNQTTVETSKVLSGLSIGIFGDVHDGTIYTRVNMRLTDLLRFNSFQALGTELNLPQTANRELDTSVRARPGDIVLLGGINNQRDTDDVAGLPGNGSSISMLTKSGKEVNRSELVIIMKPKLISFVTKKQIPSIDTKVSNAVASQPVVAVKNSVEPEVNKITKNETKTGAIVPVVNKPVNVLVQSKTDIKPTSITKNLNLVPNKSSDRIAAVAAKIVIESKKAQKEKDKTGNTPISTGVEKVDIINTIINHVVDTSPVVQIPVDGIVTVVSSLVPVNDKDAKEKIIKSNLASIAYEAQTVIEMSGDAKEVKSNVPVDVAIASETIESKPVASESIIVKSALIQEINNIKHDIDFDSKAVPLTKITVEQAILNNEILNNPNKFLQSKYKNGNFQEKNKEIDYLNNANLTEAKSNVTSRNKEWNMLLSDKSISVMLKKWATNEGYELLWTAAKDVYIQGDVMIIADSLNEAVQFVLNKSNALGHSFVMSTVNKKITIK